LGLPAVVFLQQRCGLFGGFTAGGQELLVAAIQVQPKSSLLEQRCLHHGSHALQRRGRLFLDSLVLLERALERCMAVAALPFEVLLCVFAFIFVKGLLRLQNRQLFGHAFVGGGPRRELLDALLVGGHPRLQSRDPVVEIQQRAARGRRNGRSLAERGREGLVEFVIGQFERSFQLVRSFKNSG
jgi:hypothetical protein